MPEEHEQARSRRLALLLGRLPEAIRTRVTWLLEPSHRWARIPAGVLFLLGGCLWFLPILGLWMLPVGVLLLAEDIPSLRRATGRALAWVESRHPGWLGLPG